mmetsp:Transcript_1697/g.10441  ORF Transcript_1697/g.10441 Transcript_1697/m.10441 type:complete len:132 (+) Transcript_1697:127-522(+)
MILTSHPLRAPWTKAPIRGSVRPRLCAEATGVREGGQCRSASIHSIARRCVGVRDGEPNARLVEQTPNDRLQVGCKDSKFPCWRSRDERSFPDTIMKQRPLRDLPTAAYPGARAKATHGSGRMKHNPLGLL